MIKNIKVKTTNVGERLDKFLADKTKFSRSQIQKMIKEGLILVGEKEALPHYFLKINDEVKITSTKITPTEKTIGNRSLPSFKLNIISETPDYLVINKPAGIPVHPDERYKTGTLIQEIAKKYPEIKKIGDDSTRPGVVHRLDKDVSGLMVVARTKAMFDYLKNQFEERKIKKEYLALVNGQVQPTEGQISFPLARTKKGLMAARPHNQEGRPALTEYEVIKNFINFSLVKVNIKTGRTHQIRAHFKAMNHPVVGDDLYKVRKQKTDKIPLERIWLHAQTLGFYDLKNDWQEFTTEPPTELTGYLKQIK